LHINTVFLQAFAKPQDDGRVRAVYFPNRHLPVRADLFNRVAWQLRNRAQVKIYAGMPVQALDLDARAPIAQVYEDLAHHAIFDGLLFHDDVLAGNGADAREAQTRIDSRAFTDFTLELAARVRAIRGAAILTARTLPVPPTINPASDPGFTQNLDDFLAAYDWVVPMVTPQAEPMRRTHAWLDRLVDAIAARPGALAKTAFEVQARAPRDAGAIATPLLAAWMRQLQLRGVASFGYAPDDVAADHPHFDTIRPAISTAWFPFREDGTILGPYED